MKIYEAILTICFKLGLFSHQVSNGFSFTVFLQGFRRQTKKICQTFFWSLVTLVVFFIIKTKVLYCFWIQYFDLYNCLCLNYNADMSFDCSRSYYGQLDYDKNARSGNIVRNPSERISVWCLGCKFFLLPIIARERQLFFHQEMQQSLVIKIHSIVYCQHLERK